MNLFLKEARNCLTLKKPLCIILGNDSCDLDSAVCALSVAFMYTKYPQSIENLRVDTPIIPVLNTSRLNLPLKTEVTYFLKKNKILLDNVICSDEIPAPLLAISKFILVDHHVSPFNKNTIKVIDHRPFYSQSNLPADCQINITEVGSCATLVVDSLFKSLNIYENANIKLDIKDILKMLYAPIVLDTVNFSKQADKATLLDQMICNELEKMLDIDEAERTHLFYELVAARTDVSFLDSLQILSKDLKIISNFDGKRVIAIAGFPISVYEYINMADAKENLLKFAEINQCDVVLLMGMEIKDKTVFRDLGIVNIKDNRLFDEIIKQLVNINSSLALEPLQDIEFLSGHFFSQANVKASRKQILPMVKKVLDNLYGGEC